MKIQNVSLSEMPRLIVVITGGKPMQEAFPFHALMSEV